LEISVPQDPSFITSNCTGVPQQRAEQFISGNRIREAMGHMKASLDFSKNTFLNLYLQGFTGPTEKASTSVTRSPYSSRAGRYWRN
jgi:hypothetical protein